MLKYKVGDIVTLNSKVYGDLQGYFRPGVQVKIENLYDNFPCPSDNHYTARLVSNSGKVWRIKDFEIEEKQMFNIKTDPWFIRVNSEQEFEVIQDWLEENYGEKLRANYGTHMKWLTNTQCDGYINSKLLVMHGRGHPLETTSRKEIKLTFKTIIDSVTFPEVESEQQVKMKQLQETIDKAARELKELREIEGEYK